VLSSNGFPEIVEPVRREGEQSQTRLLSKRAAEMQTVSGIDKRTSKVTSIEIYLDHECCQNIFQSGKTENLRTEQDLSCLRILLLITLQFWVAPLLNTIMTLDVTFSQAAAP
jgi:hypothetical protein